MNLSTIEKEAINKINSVKDLDELEKNRLFYLEVHLLWSLGLMQIFFLHQVLMNQVF